MVKDIDNAFDHMEFVFCLNTVRRIILVKIGLFFQEITFISEFPFATPIFNRWQMGFSGGKFATVNFELWTDRLLKRM